MKILELVKLLEEVRDIHGDIEVTYQTDDFYKDIQGFNYHPASNSMEPERIELW